MKPPNLSLPKADCIYLSFCFLKVKLIRIPLFIAEVYPKRFISALHFLFTVAFFLSLLIFRLNPIFSSFLVGFFRISDNSFDFPSLSSVQLP